MTKKTENLDRNVPLTKKVNALLKHALKMKDHLLHLYQPVREQSSYPHLDLESPTNLLKSMSNMSVFKSVRWKSMLLIGGREILNTYYHFLRAKASCVAGM